MYELRTAGAYCPALPVALGLRCECELYGTAANQVKILCSQGAQYGSMVCFYGAGLRALAFFMQKSFGYARRVLFSGGISYLTRKRFYRRFPVFVSKSYTTFSHKTKSSLYRLLFSVRVELSSRAVASQVLSP